MSLLENSARAQRKRVNHELRSPLTSGLLLWYGRDMRYFDAHCHIQFDSFDEDREVVLAAMREEEVGGIVVGVDYASSKSAIALAQKHEGLSASVGLHPNAAALEPFELETFGALAEDATVVALGECGLDYYRPESPDAAKQKQKEVFEKHIEIAAKLRKPLMIHARPSKGTQDAYDDLIGMLTSYKQDYGDALTGNIHFFVGGVEQARQLVALDFTLSYTAVLTFARDYDDVVRSIPSTHLITETDSPYVAPAPNRGKRNDPRAVKSVVAAMASIRGENEEAVRIQVLENARRVFGVDIGSA